MVQGGAAQVDVVVGLLARRQRDPAVHHRQLCAPASASSSRLGSATATAGSFDCGAHQPARNQPPGADQRLVLDARNADHLAGGDVGQARADHVVDLEPQERRQLGHVDPGPGVKFGVHEPRTHGVHTDAGARATRRPGPR